MAPGWCEDKGVRAKIAGAKGAKDVGGGDE